MGMYASILILLLGTSGALGAVKAAAGLEAIKTGFLSAAGEVSADSEAADVRLVCLNGIFWEWGQRYLTIIQTTPDLSPTDIDSFTRFVAILAQAKSENQLNYDKVRPGIVDKVAQFIEAQRKSGKWPADAGKAALTLEDVKTAVYRSNLQSCEDPTFLKGIDSKLDKTYDNIVDNQFAFKLYTLEDMAVRAVPSLMSSGRSARTTTFESMGSTICSDFSPARIRSNPDVKLSEPKETKMTLRAFIEKRRKDLGK